MEGANLCSRHYARTFRPLALQAAICSDIISAWERFIFSINTKVNTYIGYGNKGFVEGDTIFLYRCNPLDPNTMNDITDATESARTILLGLNREWINKQGDLFVESSINFVTAIIWFLKKYAYGK